ncbi:MAG: hypothetical protein U1F46_00200 [Marinagarivorans sp.]
MALASAIIAAFTLLLVVAAWTINTLRSHEGKSYFIKSLIALIALLFTFGSGLCALGATIILNPVAILAFAALITCGYACKAVFKWQQGLPVTPVHPLVQVAAAIILTTSAYVVTAYTLRIAG